VPITIADVAARAKVSKTTVSRGLDGRGELNESTAARVRKVIEEMGYVPSSRPVDLARGRTRVVGMLVPPLTRPWIGEVVQDAVDVLETERYGLLLLTCNRGDESMRQFGAQVSAKSFDGLLIIEPEGTLDYITTLHARDLPVVLIDDRDVQPDQIPSMGTTNHTGAGAAAQHLLSLGRSKPLVIAGPERFGCTMSLCSKTVLKSSPASNAAALCRSRTRSCRRARWARSRHACGSPTSRASTQPSTVITATFTVRASTAVHNRHRTALPRAPLSPDFRNT
jgi:DNA-binding LacI/PurR family transcriptional regulator